MLASGREVQEKVSFSSQADFRSASPNVSSIVGSVPAAQLPKAIGGCHHLRLPESLCRCIDGRGKGDCTVITDEFTASYLGRGTGYPPTPGSGIPAGTARQNGPENQGAAPARAAATGGTRTAGAALQPIAEVICRHEDSAAQVCPMLQQKETIPAFSHLHLKKEHPPGWGVPTPIVTFGGNPLSYPTPGHPAGPVIQEDVMRRILGTNK